MAISSIPHSVRRNVKGRQHHLLAAPDCPEVGRSGDRPRKSGRRGSSIAFITSTLCGPTISRSVTQERYCPPAESSSRCSSPITSQSRW
jgi:hypothetical protein